MEIEAKRALTQEAYDDLTPLDSLAPFTLSEPQVRQVHDEYLDSEDWAMVASGYACRLRSYGDDRQPLATLKAMDSAQDFVHRRQEFQLVLPRPCPPAEWPPGPLRDLVLGRIGDRHVVTLAVLDQERTIREVSRRDRLVAEISVDRVQVAAPEGAAPWFEVEIELKGEGTEGDLAELVGLLEEKWPLASETRSKFERALEMVQDEDGWGQILDARQRAICLQIARREDMYRRRAHALLALDEGTIQREAGDRASLSARRVRYWLAEFRRRGMHVFPERVLSEATALSLDRVAIAAAWWDDAPPPKQEKPRKRNVKGPQLSREDAIIEAVRKALSYHYQEMVRHEPGTRAGEDPEELHDMRVAARRMRAAFRVFDDYLDSHVMKPFVKGVNRTRRSLGDVRDLDVFWTKTKEYVDSEANVKASDLAPLHKAWETERERRRKGMLEYLDSEAYALFKEEFAAFLQDAEGGGAKLFTKKGEPRPHRLGSVIPVLLYQRLADVQAYEGWVADADVPLSRLHRLRIAVKRLRYTAEFLQSVLGAESEELIDELKRLQDHLGDLQDAVVASQILQAFMTWGTWPDESKRKRIPEEPMVAPGVAAYLASTQRELQTLVDTFPKAWRRINSQDFKTLLRSALVP